MTVGGSLGRRLTVLLADDDQSFGRGLALLLRSHFRMVVTQGSEEALSWCEQGRPAAALVDLEMPRFLAPASEEEGIHLARALKQRLGTRFPVVLVTRHEAREIPSSMLSELDGFFRKPLAANDLVAHLQRLIPPALAATPYGCG